MRVVTEAPKRDGDINIMEYGRIVWRKKWLLVLPLLVAGLVTSIGVRFLSPVYEARSIIRLDRDLDVSPDVAQILQVQQNRRARDQETLKLLEIELTSTVFVDQIIEYFGLANDPRLIHRAQVEQANFPGLSAEEIVSRRLRKLIRRKVTIKNAGPGMFMIRCLDYKAENCFLLAEVMTDLFIRSRQTRSVRSHQEVGEFTDEQVAIYEQAVRSSEIEYEGAKRRMRENTLVGNPIANSNIQFAENFRRQINIRIRDDQETVDNVRATLVDGGGSEPTPFDVASDAELRSLRNRMSSRHHAELLLELSSADAAVGELVRTREELSSTALRCQRYLSTWVPGMYPQLDPDYRALMVEYYFQSLKLALLREKRDKLSGYIDAFKSNTRLKPQLEVALATAREKVESNKARVKQLMAAKTKTQISEAAQSTRLGAEVVIVEPPSIPLRPSRPNKLKIIIFGLLFGGMLGVGGLFLSEFVDSSFREVKDIEEKLGWRVIGTVPHFESPSQWQKTRTRQRTVVWAAVSIVVIALSLSGFFVYGRLAADSTIHIEASRSETSATEADPQ